MRKKTVTHSVKTIFWWFIYCLPLICYLLVVWGFVRNDGFPDPFGTIMSDLSFHYPNVVFDSLYDFFGPDGILPFFNDSSGVLQFFAYFIGMNLLHLAVDFILFIPRLCHKFMNKFTRSEDCE